MSDVGRVPATQFTQAIAIFQDRCRGVTWERGTAELFLLRTLFMMGEFAEAGRLSVPLLKDARERGDLYSAIMNGAYLGANVHLAADDVDRGTGPGARAGGRVAVRGVQHPAVARLWGETVHRPLRGRRDRGLGPPQPHLAVDAESRKSSRSSTSGCYRSVPQRTGRSRPGRGPGPSHCWLPQRQMPADWRVPR